MNEQEIRKIIQEEIKKAAQTAQYGVTRVPVHTHNNIDSPNLPPHSVTGFQNLPANQTPAASAGVLGVLAGQSVSGPPSDPLVISPSTIPTLLPQISVFPIPIIYGYGVGVHSAFNGGEAPNGTVLFFSNGLTLSGLWVKTPDGWYGFSPDSLI